MGSHGNYSRVRVPCSGEIHEIILTDKGHIVAPNHPNVPILLLETEARMCEGSSCGEVILGIKYGNPNHLWGNISLSFLYGESLIFQGAAERRRNRRDRKERAPFDDLSREYLFQKTVRQALERLRTNRTGASTLLVESTLDNASKPLVRIKVNEVHVRDLAPIRVESVSGMYIKVRMPITVWAPIYTRKLSNPLFNGEEVFAFQLVEDGPEPVVLAAVPILGPDSTWTNCKAKLHKRFDRWHVAEIRA